MIFENIQTSKNDKIVKSNFENNISQFFQYLIYLVLTEK